MAHHLVSNKLIACCNIIGNNENAVTSIYSWEGKIEEDKEILMIMKSRTNLKEKIIDEVKKNHPAQVPEIICTPIIAGYAPYLDWVLQSTKTE